MTETELRNYVLNIKAVCSRCIMEHEDSCNACPVRLSLDEIFSKNFVKNATFVSVDAMGKEFAQPCKVNTATREIFDLVPLDNTDAEMIVREYVIVDGEPCTICYFGDSNNKQADYRLSLWHRPRYAQDV